MIHLKRSKLRPGQALVCRPQHPRQAWAGLGWIGLIFTALGCRLPSFSSKPYLTCKKGPTSLSGACPVLRKGPEESVLSESPSASARPLRNRPVPLIRFSSYPELPTPGQGTSSSTAEHREGHKPKPDDDPLSKELTSTRLKARPSCKYKEGS